MPTLPQREKVGTPKLAVWPIKKWGESLAPIQGENY